MMIYCKYDIFIYELLYDKDSEKQLINVQNNMYVKKLYTFLNSLY